MCFSAGRAKQILALATAKRSGNSLTGRPLGAAALGGGLPLVTFSRRQKQQQKRATEDDYLLDSLQTTPKKQRIPEPGSTGGSECRG